MCWAVNNERGSKEQSKYTTCLQVESSAYKLLRARIISDWLGVVRFCMSYIDFTRRTSLMKNSEVQNVPKFETFWSLFYNSKKKVRFHKLLEFRLLN